MTEEFRIKFENEAQRKHPYTDDETAAGWDMITNLEHSRFLDGTKYAYDSLVEELDAERAKIDYLKKAYEGLHAENAQLKALLETFKDVKMFGKAHD